MNENEQQYNRMVCVKCFTFNHAPYIEDAMNGFCMQETDFPFVCVIVDDASTDGEPEVIKKYLIEHFDLDDTRIVRKEETADFVMTFARHKENKNCFFAVYFLKYNHYSIKKKKMPYLSEWHNHTKYVALCEGDDYWVYSKKLQEQYSFMELHPECSMCFHSNEIIYPSGKKMLHKPNIIKEQYTVEDAILGGGGFMATNSMFYKWIYFYQEQSPIFLKNCPIGDLPTMLFLAAKGNMGYIDKPMSVYRRNSVGSWTSKHNTIKRLIIHHKAITKMYKEYDVYTQHVYHHVIEKRNRYRRNDNTRLIVRIILKRLYKFLTSGFHELIIYF